MMRAEIATMLVEVLAALDGCSDELQAVRLIQSWRDRPAMHCADDPRPFVGLPAVPAGPDADALYDVLETAVFDRVVTTAYTLSVAGLAVATASDYDRRLFGRLAREGHFDNVLEDQLNDAIAHVKVSTLYWLWRQLAAGSNTVRQWARSVNGDAHDEPRC